MRHVLITGGAGFIGSRIVRHHVDAGDAVAIVDDMSTGQITELISGASVYQMDVSRSTGFSEMDVVYHLASPASPDVFLDNWDGVVRANITGLMVASRALRPGGLLVVASSSEAYGQPPVMMTEDCLGLVRTQSVRGVYDESKRLLEAMAWSIARREGVASLVLRIFNTYGPGMPDDGRVINTFVRQALAGEPLTVHGTGMQSRSFGYVDDTVRQIVGLVEGGVVQPRQSEVFNVGCDQERTVRDAAQVVARLTDARIEYVPSPRPDDPAWRQPVLDRVTAMLGPQKFVSLEEGIERCLS